MGGGGELYNKITIPCLIPYGSTLTSVIEGGGAGVDPGFLGGGGPKVEYMHAERADFCILPCIKLVAMPVANSNAGHANYAIFLAYYAYAQFPMGSPIMLYIHNLPKR